jgi:hypothetical protein
MWWELTKAHTTQPIKHCKSDNPQEGPNAENIEHGKGEDENHHSLYHHHNKLRHHMWE